MSPPPPSPQLHTAINLISALTLISTALHLLSARIYRGHARGHALSLLHSILPYYLTLTLLLLSLLALLALYLHTLFSHPTQAGSKSELLISFTAILALSWGGFLPHDRRRRIVAVRLATIPCFGNGHHATSHQLLPTNTCMLAFDPSYIAPTRAPVPVSSSVTSSPPQHSVLPESPASLSPLITALSDRPVGALGLPIRKVDRKRSSTLGIMKHKVWEFSCRSASTWVYGRAKRQAWPLNVVRTIRLTGKRFVLIKDETVQDGAGAALLEPAFTQSRHLDKALIARVVFDAISRSTPCVLNNWTKQFEAQIFGRFAQLPAIVSMLTGELREDVENRRRDGANGAGEDEERCYISELLWAIITVEVLDYLQYKRRDIPMLTWFTRLPIRLCEDDASNVKDEMNAVFETWKAGRLCGSSLSRPCDSECCCHGVAGQGWCRCQCPCVCDCP